MLRLSLLIVPLFFAQSLFAQSYLKDSTKVREHSSSFMEHIVKGEVGKAFSSYKKYSPVSDKEVDRLASKLKGQLSDYKDRYGGLIDQSFLMENALGPYLLERVHLVRYKEQPVRFHFIYYRSEGGWIVNYIRWKPTIRELFGN